MIADYSVEIKIAIVQSFGNANVTNEDRRQLLCESRQKTARFNSVNSKIIGQKFTKFGYDVA